MGLEFTDTNQTKKPRLSTDNVETKDVFLEAPKIDLDRCTICKQYLNEIEIYLGHPEDAAEEYMALTSENLLLFNGNEEIHEDYVQPTNKLTHFTVYDRSNHVCSFDTGLISDNKQLYVSGYIKAVYDEDPFIDNGVPAKDIGPIIEWYMTGFDGFEQAIFGFKTQFSDYYLMHPSKQYEPFMVGVNQKMALAKLVIEFLLESTSKSPSYEDLLLAISSSEDKNLNEEVLIRHAQFIYDQVTNFDSTADPDETQLISTPCMKSLIALAGVSIDDGSNFFTNSINLDLEQKRDDQREYDRNETYSHSTITPLVRDVFDSFFKERDKEINEDNINGNTTGNQSKYCSSCTYAKSRICKHVEEDENNFNLNDSINNYSRSVRLNGNISNNHLKLNGNPELTEKNIEWIGDFIEENDSKFYKAVKIDEIVLFPGDYILLDTIKTKDSSIALIRTMFSDDFTDNHQLHVQIFEHGSNTILGECADPKELFLIDQCFNADVKSVHKKVKVSRKKFDYSWKLNGGLEAVLDPEEFAGDDYYFSKKYIREVGRFEDINEISNFWNTDCASCIINKNTKFTPTLINDHILWNSEEYKISSAVYLKPKSFDFKLIDYFKITDETREINGIVDNELYPEYYRKLPNGIVKGSNIDYSEPFCIGIITDILPIRENIQIKVRKLYRPENTHKGSLLTHQQDMNVLYWSEEEIVLSFSQVEGKCYVAYGHILNTEDWTSEGPDRFFFIQTYNAEAKVFEEPSDYARKFGQLPKSSTKNKSSLRPKSSSPHTPHSLPPSHPSLSPLHCMNVFADCGGLSYGLRSSSAAETHWAVEQDKPAAKAFRRNYPDSQTYINDANTVLKRIIAYDRDVMDQPSGSGEWRRRYPGKGDVQLLVGGPPCERFVNENTYKSSQYDLFKNSPIITYLSYCDFFRPAYFLFENVPEFVGFQKGMVLKLTLRCLLAIGYQVTFGIVQAGHYGVPQDRRHLIIMAAAPGYVLPKFPEPLHVFNSNNWLTVQIDGNKYNNGLRWTNSAPYRKITIRDALSDLPPIPNGCSSRSVRYNSLPLTHYQRQMRAEPTSEPCDDPLHVYDHMCKEMAPLVVARMRHMPLSNGSDWRDLPNIVVKLDDGSSTVKLRYPYKGRKQKADSKESNKAVCQCATVPHTSCDPADRQHNTLIPWCLPHTADRHNQWAGLYGRLGWSEHFPTATTNPEPMGKQGRILHPDQHRVISVRESARSQGFPDSYEFYGKLMDKYHQVGNSVPPPLGAALGREIMKAYSQSLTKETTD